MQRIWFFCLAFLMLACVAQPQSTPPPPIATDIATTPLAQPSAVPARTGASGAFVMLRRAIDDNSYFPQPPSSKRFQDEVHLVDPTTGEDLPGHPPLLVRSLTLSADGGRAVGIESHGQSCQAMAGGSACYASADVLHLLDVGAWHEVTRTLSTTAWADWLNFSPDGKHIILSLQEKQSSTLLMLDAFTGQELKRRALPLRPSRLRYTGDGGSIIIYGQPLSSDPGNTQPDPPRVLWVDAVTLDSQWEQTLANILSGSWCLDRCQASHEERVSASWMPAVVFARNARKVYIVHADADRLTTVDFGTRTTQTVEVRAERSWLERVFDLTALVAEAKGVTQGAYKSAALSPDGTRLYVAGRVYTEADSGFGEPRNLQVIDVVNGRVLASRPSEAVSVALSPSGAYLWLEAPGKYTLWSEVLDAQTLTPVKRFEEGWHLVGVRGTDGQPLVVASQYLQPNQMGVLDQRTFEMTHVWTAKGHAAWVVQP